jgi:hypothetical protein
MKVLRSAARLLTQGVSANHWAGFLLPPIPTDSRAALAHAHRPDPQVPKDYELGPCSHGKIGAFYFYADGSKDDPAFGFCEIGVSVQRVAEETPARGERIITSNVSPALLKLIDECLALVSRDFAIDPHRST